VVKARGHWDGDLWHSLHLCNGMATPSGCIFHPVTAGVGLSPSSDPRAHFGSGTESKANSIDMRWPSGIVQTVRDAASALVIKIEGPPK
jgi:enediyne biosynthesis protein E4